MFRKMRRSGQQLPEQECIEVLRQAPRGVLALHGEDGYPYAFPMNYAYTDGRLYFHCAKEGHKIDALAGDGRACFCVMDEGFRKEGEWALHIRSIVVFGTVKKITDPGESIRLVREIALKYSPTVEEAEENVRKSGARAQMLEMSIDHMTGKLVEEA